MTFSTYMNYNLLIYYIQRLRQQDVRIFAVGIDPLNRSELENIASKPASVYSFIVNGFPNLRGLYALIMLPINNLMCPGKLLVTFINFVFNSVKLFQSSIYLNILINTVNISLLEVFFFL